MKTMQLRILIEQKQYDLNDYFVHFNAIACVIIVFYTQKCIQSCWQNYAGDRYFCYGNFFRLPDYFYGINTELIFTNLCSHLHRTIPSKTWLSICHCKLLFSQKIVTKWGIFLPNQHEVYPMYFRRRCQMTKIEGYDWIAKRRLTRKRDNQNKKPQHVHFSWNDCN